LQTEKRLFESLVIPDDRHMVDDRLLHVLAEAQHSLDVTSHDVVVCIQHASKGLRWIRRRSRVRHLIDGQVRVYGLLSDVTDERTQALELSRAKDDAENASRAKSEFMASMSHEIRTPMNAILGLTELLLGTPLNDQQRRHAQLVYRSGENLLEIINDILDFSKIEAGHLELAPTEFSIQSLLDDVLELMAHKAHEKGIEITAHFESEMPTAVMADPLRLQQILTNLISNAIKFTDHGEVVVTVKCQVSETVNEPASSSLPVVPLTHMNITFVIRDTGIGISQQVIPKLFSAFTQANASLARRYGGTGLGLAITKQLVELMGGQISVQSALGVGSEFSFNVPVTVADASAEKGHTDDLAMPHLGILVVDDNATNRTVLENILSAWGMDVVCTADGQEALDYLLTDSNEDRQIDMALVDMNMPRVDGFGFAEKLKASGRYKNLRMVLLSSTSTNDDVRRSQELGYSRFVAKPLRKPELRQAILGLTADLLPPASQLPSLKLNVLVIEDNAVNREVCAQMLVRLGCRAHLASSAMEGLKKLCETRFDIVLLDIAMPGMDGEETIQQFRSSRVTRFKFVTPTDTPVIAVTAHVEEQRFLELGFDAFLLKPYRLHQLSRVIQACMRSTGKPLPLVNQSSPNWPTTTASISRGDMSAPNHVQATVHPWKEVFEEAAVMRLLELDPTGKNHLLERVTKMFEASVDKYLLQLEEAWLAEDLKSIKDVVHTLKSSSANVGAIKLSQCCIEVEHAMKDAKHLDLPDLITSLKQAARAVQSALPRLLEAHR
jgi:signal transduction histidine kinase/DNA-binding response OmpR family regulator